MAVASAYDLNSAPVTIPIPQKGKADPSLDLTAPARWNQQTKLDDPGAVWDFIQRLEKSAGVIAFDSGLTAESGDRQQSVDYSGALDGGYDAAALKSVAGKLQEIVTGGSLRMTVGSLGFSTGQALLDWLKATNQPFDAAKVTQPFTFPKATP